MPLSSPLSGTPYNDDYDESKNYYQQVFRGGVSVQTRELNQLQTMAQKQIERVGDNLFKAGTITSGCNFRFLNPYPYVKITDLEQGGQVAIPGNYVGFFIKNSANLQALVVDSVDGFESTSPDLKTLYLHYRNAGSDYNTHAFSAADVLTVFDSNVSIFTVNVENGGVGFSNADAVVFTPSIIVNVSSGTFTNGAYVTQASTSSNLQIVGVDDITLALSGQVILRLQPRNADLANASAPSTMWALANNESIRNSDNTAVATVESVIGAGAEASVTTDGSGRVTSVTMIEQGHGYEQLPTVRIRSANNASGLTSLSLTPKNYLCRVTVEDNPSAVGNGYAFEVGEGVIYQKGYMLRVAPQKIIVSKYDQLPNAVSVGFMTRESIIDENTDTSLYDNSVEGNATAPGAKRLKLEPELVLSNTQSSDFFPICSWTEGNPYRQNRETVYSRIGDEMSRRTFEDGGNFVLDKFLVTTRSPLNPNNEGNTFSCVIDPGTAYIRGYRVATLHNHVIDVQKGTDTSTSNAAQVQLGYGNFVRVKELGGVFQFNTGDTVSLRSAAKNYLSNTSLVTSGNTTPQGTEIGTARIRSLVRESGIQGNPECVYRLYMFSVQMNPGRNFREVRGISYDGATYDGICDVVLSQDATLNANVAKLMFPDMSALLFQSGAISLLNAANTQYTYRTIDQGATVANTGILTKSLAGSPNEFFPYGVGSLSQDELEDVIIQPHVDLVASANISGTVTVNTTSAVMVGSGTAFLSDLQVGQWVRPYQNSTVYETKRVISIANNTNVTLDSNCSFSQSGLACYEVYPKNVPVGLGTLDQCTANLDSNTNILRINLGFALEGSTSKNVALTYDVLTTEATPETKTPNRGQFVKFCTSNNAGGTQGPWCFGVPDVFRLRGVWVGNSSVNTSSREVTGFFYADTNQEEDFLNLSYLMLKPNSGFTLGANDYVLAQFDYTTVSGTGYHSAVSYLGSNAAQIQARDSLGLSSLTDFYNSFEVPEVQTQGGRYFDLLNTFDFRPVVANTVAPTTNSESAPLNPANTISFGNTADPANDKKFPLPGSTLTSNLTYYIGRVDSVVLSPDGSISVLRGTPGADLNRMKVPNIPYGSIKLNDLMIPAYPNAPQRPSLRQLEIYNTRMATETYAFTRLRGSTITTPLNEEGVESQQPTRYSHKAVGKLARRIRNLEYYQALSVMETDITNRIIPSSVDGTQNRFKFGFMVDDFSSLVSQQSDSPQYAASVSNGKLRPPVVEWTLRHGLGVVTVQPHVHHAVISQNNATVDDSILVPNTSTGLVANSWLLRFDQLHTERRNPADLPINPEDVVRVTFANSAAPAALYFHVPPTFLIIDVAHWDPVSFEIWQGNTLIKTTAIDGDAVALTNTDMMRLHSNVVPSDWFSNTVFANLDVLEYVGNDVFVAGSGKITWNHNPALGNEYTIISHKFNIYDHWRWGLEYPSLYAQNAASYAVTTNATSYAGVPDVQPPSMLLSITDNLAHPNLDGQNGGPDSMWETWETIVNPSQAQVDFLVAHTIDPSQGAGVVDAAGLWLGTQAIWRQSMAMPFDLQTDEYTQSDHGLDSSDLIATATARSRLYRNYRSGDTGAFAGATSLKNVSLMSHVFRFQAYGLKPLTRHFFKVQSIDKSARCRPVGGILGGNLITDARGFIAFDYFYDGSVLDSDITSTLLSNTAPLDTNYYHGTLGNFLPAVDAGNLQLLLEAPGSTATFMLPVVADLSIPLSLIRGRNYTNLF